METPSVVTSNQVLQTESVCSWVGSGPQSHTLCDNTAINGDKLGDIANLLPSTYTNTDGNVTAGRHRCSATLVTTRGFKEMLVTSCCHQQTDCNINMEFVQLVTQREKIQRNAIKSPGNEWRLLVTRRLRSYCTFMWFTVKMESRL